MGTFLASGLRMAVWPADVHGFWSPGSVSLLAISIFEKYNRSKACREEEEREKRQKRQGRERYDERVSGVAVPDPIGTDPTKTLFRMRKCEASAWPYGRIGTRNALGPLLVQQFKYL